jgi:hypothetical protein
MAERTTVRLPPDLIARAKRRAAADGRTLTSLIEEGVRAVVDERSRPLKRRRVVLPVSKATGWLRPGVELAEAEEAQDLEYVERMKHLK